MKKSILALIIALALILVSCATKAPVAEVTTPEPVAEPTPAPVVETVPALQLEASYNVTLGYDFVYELEGNVVAFKYVDMYGDSELEAIGADLMKVLEGAQSYKIANPGRIEIKLASNLTAEQFEAFVETTNEKIYNSFFK